MAYKEELNLSKSSTNGLVRTIKELNKKIWTSDVPVFVVFEMKELLED